MREMLEPIFGQSGAVVAQFFVILVLVLILFGLGWWLFRQYGGFGLGGGNRGRAPRLGIIDSLSIDHRHRLVLIRRDNVEHLILIGRTADLVVEPSIVRAIPAGGRPRQGQTARQQPPTRPAANGPGAAPSAAARPPDRPQAPASAPTRMDDTGISEPIPFPQGRRPQAQPAARAAEAETAETEPDGVLFEEPVPQRRAAARNMSSPGAPVSVAAATAFSAASASAHFEEPTRPTRVDSAFSLADALDEIADAPVAARDGNEPPSPDAHESSRAQTAEIDESPAGAGHMAEQPAMVNGDASEEWPDEREADVDSATKVSNLEQEMARLLGEITAKREP